MCKTFISYQFSLQTDRRTDGRTITNFIWRERWSLRPTAPHPCTLRILANVNPFKEYSLSVCHQVSPSVYSSVCLTIKLALVRIDFMMKTHFMLIMLFHSYNNHTSLVLETSIWQIYHLCLWTILVWNKIAMMVSPQLIMMLYMYLLVIMMMMQISDAAPVEKVTEIAVNVKGVYVLSNKNIVCN